MQALPPSSTANWQLWLLPRFTLLLFVVAVIGLLAYLRNSGREEARLVLINDVLWIEQNLHFQFEQTEERLASLLNAAREGNLDDVTFQTRAHLISEANSAIVGVHLLSGSRVYHRGEAMPATGLDDARKLAHANGKANYSDVLGHDGRIGIVMQGQGHEIAALISLPRLLSTQVPWWFANKYRLAVIDARSQEVASKSHVAADEEGLSYELDFDPPGHGLRLQVTAYSSPTGIVQKGLVAGVIVLALIVLFSWWRLQAQVQGRLSAELALREEYAFRTAMENSLSVGMRARDLQGKMIYVNPAFCRMVGYSAEELIGSMPPYPYWNPDDIAHHRALNETVLAGLAPQDGYEFTLRHRDGHLVITRVYTSPLIDATGKQSGWMSSVLDITAQKAAEAREHEQEEKLRQTGRLIAMGEMASTLAHELNQPLMAMSTYAGAARQFASQGEAGMLDSTLNKIAEQALRAAGVVRRIREFVRKHAPHREPCDLNTIALDALELLDSDAHARDVRIRRDLAEDMPQIQADRVLLGQVMVNLLRNAVDACSEQPPERRDVLLQTRYQADTVQLTVYDRGHGITPASGDRLFEAFYTTKPLGMGIGLNICRSIIEQHHGQLGYENLPEGGTAFHLSLPR
ncbi:sensor histidine kinase [Chitinimonas sp. BJB300]|uniref:sensor histidine kinase n=1 Tax=Chitinimonas sp. BJB300 TaxID=1559339 RepID=UPI000C0DA119|nr:PAS domain-containing sensor histidine kinase [Chitinimonas sp. BJB300]PHV12440.1 PAS domain-containing sensor histidine kinase [Chitinimonas sp. BJB300]TSJ88562.1 PAS domain S-box protein [Chitinimonas sp. BJB300]